MTDDRTAKQRPPEQRERERALETRQPRRDDKGGERKASPIEHREWRGSGVCGDRHTD